MRILLILLAGLACLVVCALLVFYAQNRRVPELGVKDGFLSPLKATPNGVSSQGETGAKQIAPWAMKETPQHSVEAIRAALIEMGGELVTEDANYLRALFTTPVMGWRDDVEFYIDTQADVVQLRSQSRAGISDRGVNRKRLKQLHEIYQR